jgi:hypothetical protein
VAPGAITVPLADKNLAEDGTPTEARTVAEIGRVLDGFLGKSIRG